MVLIPRSTSVTSLCLWLFVNTVGSFAIDNEVIGEPKVDCEDTMLALTFKTKKPFSGRVYVQGLSDDERCSRGFAQNANQSRFSLVVQNGDCTMQRHRVSGKLEGIMFSLTIVVSFHGTFVTKADRAYRCMCFFRSTRRLTNAIEMAALGTTELVDTAPTPSCAYGIRQGSPDGPPVVYGQIGDKIFHVWECESSHQGMLVHSCTVTDGRGFKFDLLDVDGCAIDPLIQPDLKYDNGLKRAFTETWGYKFSDTSVLNYECVIELCDKETTECEKFAPPNCGRAKRSVGYSRRNTQEERPRFIGTTKDHQTVEVLASINMIDTVVQKKVGTDIALLENATVTRVHEAISILDRELCFTYSTAAVMGAGVLTCLLCSIVIGCVMARRHVYKIDN